MLDVFETLSEGWEVTWQDADGGHARYDAGDGHVDLAYYALLPGLLLTDIDLSCSVLPASFPLGPHLATVNWCALGRCEVDLADLGSLVVSKDELCVSSAFATSFSYPTGAYQGFELFVDLDSIDEDSWVLLAAFGLHERALAESLCPAGLGAILVPAGPLDEAVKAVAAELSLPQPRTGWLLLRAIGLLMALTQMDLNSLATTGSYLLRSQRDMAQAVHQRLVGVTGPAANLGSLARHFGVSEASLRSYFARVYGESPAAFVRRRTLAEAARLLLETDRKVADIGLACGYANPSKFSAAFRRAYGVNPLEYRRRSRFS